VQFTRRHLFAASAGIFASCRRQRNGFNGYAFVANQEGRAVAAVDLAGAFVVAQYIELEDAPTAILAHPSRPFVYALTSSSGVIYEISSNNLKISRKVHTAAPADCMRLEPGGAALWVISGARRRLSRIDLENFRIDARITTPEAAHDFDLSDWTKIGALSFGTAGSVALVDLPAAKVQRPVHLGDEIGAVRFRSDGKALLVANRGKRMLSVLDAPEGRIITHLPLAVRPDHLCFNRDQGQLFITGEGRDAVVVVFPYYVPEIAETVLAGNGPGAMAASTDFLFIANPAAGDVSIMNIERRRIVAVAAVGSEPAHVSITPDELYALVLNRRSGDMAVIHIPAIAPDRRKAAALLTMIPVGSRPVSAVAKAVG
jgi:DNA-binding beta-propeller fold protein YncE